MMRSTETEASYPQLHLGAQTDCSEGCHDERNKMDNKAEK